MNKSGSNSSNMTANQQTFVHSLPARVGSLEHTFRFLHRRNSYGKEFIKKEFDSLDYDPCENEVYMHTLKQQNFSVVALRSIRCYLNFMILGIITGTIGALIDISIVNLAHIKNSHLSKIIDACKSGGCLTKVFFTWFGSVLLFVAGSGFLAIFIEPGVTGGGIAGIVAYLNGVDVPRVLTASVVIFKSLAMICTITSGIVAGKEGPMIHVGAAMGAVLVLLPGVCYLCHPFRNDTEMRDLVAAGVAAGVSAAFGAPVGGFLLAVEESVSFLSIKLLFKIFLCALFSVGTLNYILSVYYNIPGRIQEERLLYMGKVKEEWTHFTLLEIPAFLLVGVVAGLVGSAWVYIQKHAFVLRRRFINKKWKKSLDCLVVAMLTTIAHMTSTYLSKDCVELEEPENAVKRTCSGGEYNQISLYTLHTNEECLRWLVKAPAGAISLKTALLMFFMYFGLGMYTLGASMAIGVFVPNLVLGAMWGRIVAILFNRYFPKNTWANQNKYTFLGAMAQLSGTLRLTFSVTVIALETTGNVHMVLPLMIILITAKWVGDLLTPPFFESQVVMSGMPFIVHDPPAFSEEIPIKQIMSRSVISVAPVITVNEILNIFQSYSYQGYPVVESGTLIGFILSSQILILLKYKIFMDADMDLLVIDRIINKEFRKKIKLSDLELSDRDNGQRLNLKLLMNPSPYAVRQNMSFARVFCLFRQVGLRHLLVVDNTYKVVGIITRKDLAKYHEEQEGIVQLPII